MMYIVIMTFRQWFRPDVVRTDSHTWLVNITQYFCNLHITTHRAVPENGVCFVVAIISK